MSSKSEKKKSSAPKKEKKSKKKEAKPSDNSGVEGSSDFEAGLMFNK